jgi:hypothetical protein
MYYREKDCKDNDAHLGCCWRDRLDQSRCLHTKVCQIYIQYASLDSIIPTSDRCNIPVYVLDIHLLCSRFEEG